jgi:WD40 repeat protein
VPGATNMLISLGFREEPDASLVLPLGCDLVVLNARRIELQAGLDLLLKRASATSSSASAGKAVATSPKKAKKPTASGDTMASKTTEPVPTENAENTPQPVNRPGSAGTAVNARAVVKQTLRADAALDELAEVRSKWLQAESALQHNKAVIAELQSQVVHMQNQEQSPGIPAATLSTFFNLRDIEHHGKTGPSLVKGVSGGHAATSGGVMDRYNPAVLHAAHTKGSAIVTYLTESVVPGQSKIQVATTDGVVKGMRAVIGSGSDIEVHVVSGLGSVLLASPTVKSHPMKTPIRFFEHTKRGMERMRKFMDHEFVRCLLLDEIIPNAVNLSEQKLLAADLSCIYKVRPTMEHKCVVSIEKPILLSTDKLCGSRSDAYHGSNYAVVASSEQCSLSCIYDGKVYQSEFTLNVVALLLLFEEIGLMTAASKDRRSLVDGVGFADMVRVDYLFREIHADSHWTGVFQCFAEAHKFKSINDMLEDFSEAAEDGGNAVLMSWASYVEIIIPPLAGSEVHSGLLSLSAAVAVPGAQSLGAQTVGLMSKLFHVTDIDGDDALTLAECKALFAQLDNGHDDTNEFGNAVRRTFGGSQEAQYITFEQFLTLRQFYSSAVHVCPGGLRLFGALSVLATVGHSFGFPVRGKEVTVADVSSSLSAAVIDSLVPGQYDEVGVVLANRAVSQKEMTVNDFIMLLSGDSNIGCCPVTVSPICVDDKQDIIQCITDSRQSSVLLVRNDGVVLLYSLALSQKLLEQRVIWAEPLPTRAVEGPDRFLKWRRDCGIDDDGHGNNDTDDKDSSNSEFRLQKAKETLSASAALAKFTLALLDFVSAKTEIGLAVRNIVSVDEESGLIVVNQHVASSSISILEPSSLRRLYRIRVPWRLDNEVSNFVSQVVSGSENVKLTSGLSCTGVITQLHVLSSRSAIICRVAGSNDIRIISLLTGELINDLKGHTANISCLSLRRLEDCIISGSSDCSLRVWRISDSILSSSSAAGAVDDPILNALETRVASQMAPVTSAPVGRNMYRTFMTRLMSILNLSPRWKVGIISGFFDGQDYKENFNDSSEHFSTEVVLENASSQLYSNKIMLRRVEEIEQSPFGPPLWSRPHANLQIGERVAVFEVDVDEAVVVCARLFGIFSNAKLSFSELAAYFENIFAASGSRDHATIDIRQLLVSIGVREHSEERPFHCVLKKFFAVQEKFQSSCDRVLLRHEHVVASIEFCEQAKYLVTVDVAGGCCVWDPCGVRTCLTLLDPFNKPAFTGQFPFSLVSCFNVNDHIIAESMATDTTKVEISELKGISKVTLLTDSSMSFPLSASSVMKALTVDKKYEESTVKVRGFVYVMKNLSYVGVETYCFLPALVTMDHPEFFFGQSHEQLADMHAMRGTPTDFPGVSYRDMTLLNRIFKTRDDILRIVYVVSCSHASMEALANDLNKFGVLHRGYTITPSELVEVTCFERPSYWFDRSSQAFESSSTFELGSRQVADRLLSLSNGPSAKTVTGVVIQINRDPLENNIRVALDMCNEIIFISQSQVVKIIEQFPLSSHLTHRLAVSAPKESPVASALLPGSRIELRLHPQNKAVELWSDSHQSSLRLKGESELLLLSVHMRGTRRSDGNECSYHGLLPVSIARSTHLVPAHRVDSVSVQSSYRQLAASQSLQLAVQAARLSAHSYLQKVHKQMYVNTVQSQCNLALDAIMARQANTSAAAPASSDANRLFVALVSPLELNHSRVCLDICLLMGKQRTSFSHPLFAYALSGVGNNLAMRICEDFNRLHGLCRHKCTEDSVIGAVVVDWSGSLQELESAWLMRRGLRPEELCRVQRISAKTDIDTLCTRLHARTVSTAIDSTESTTALGYVTDTSVGGLLHKVSSLVGLLDGRDATGLKDKRSKATANIADDMDLLSLMLLKHHTALVRKKHSQALKKVTNATYDSLQTAFLQIASAVHVSVDESLASGTQQHMSGSARRSAKHTTGIGGHTSSSALPSSGTYGVHSEVPITVGLSTVVACIIEAVNFNNNPNDYAVSKHYLSFAANDALLSAGSSHGGSQQYIDYNAHELEALLESHNQLLSHSARNMASLLVNSATDNSLATKLGRPYTLPLFEWQPGWQTMTKLITRGPMLTMQRMNLFRLIASGLLSAVVELNQAGFEFYAINPHTVVIDSVSAGQGVGIRLLSLPFMSRTGSDLEPTACKMLGHYVFDARRDATVLSCLPPDIRRIARKKQKKTLMSALNSSDRSQWDFWSVGGCLFHLAFGVPLESAAAEATGSGNPVANTEEAIALVLLKLATSSGQKVEMKAAATTQSVKAVDEVAPALLKLCKGGMPQLLFSLTASVTGLHVDRLQGFRDSFSSLGSTFGASLSAAGLLWNKIVQKIFVAIPGGADDVALFADRLAAQATSTASKTFTEESCKEFVKEKFGIQLQKLEFLALVDCFCVVKDSNKKASLIPFTEKAVLMIKGLSALLPDIYIFGMVQQLLYVIGTLLSLGRVSQEGAEAVITSRKAVRTASSTVLSSLLQSRILNLAEESSTHQARRELSLLFAPFQGAADFYAVTVEAPFQKSFEAMLSIIGSDASSLHQLEAVLPAVLEVSSVIGIVEELTDLAAKCLHNTLSGTKTVVESKGRYLFLSKSAASLNWIAEHVTSILQHVCDHKILEGISSFLLRFMASNVATSVDAIESVGEKFVSSDAYADINNMHGLSVGSRLLMRSTKFLQNMVNLCKEISKSANLDAIVSHSDIDLVVSSDDEAISGRILAQNLMSSLLNSVSMLCLGEEAPLTCIGPNQTMLSSALPRLFRDYHKETPLENRWSMQMYKIMEPLLVEIVGEDGHGPTRFGLAVEYIRESDNFFSKFAAFGNDATHQVSGDSFYRGAVYFGQCVRVLRMFSSSDLTAPPLMAARCQLSTCTFLLSLLPAPPESAGSGKTHNVLNMSVTSGLVQLFQLYLDCSVAQKVALLLTPSTQSVMSSTSGKSTSQTVITTVMDINTKTTIAALRLGIRVLSIIDSVPDDFFQHQLFASLASQFTGEVSLHCETLFSTFVRFYLCYISQAFVSACADILRNKSRDVDLTTTAAHCMSVMSHRRSWMRTWACFDIIPILSFVSKTVVSALNTAKEYSLAALKGLALHDSEGMDAIVGLRLPGLEHIHASSPLAQLPALVEEGNDLKFGSTISEQMKFTHQLVHWTGSLESLFDGQNMTGQLDSFGENKLKPTDWRMVYSLCGSMSMWVPKLFLSMQLSSQGAGNKDSANAHREKLVSSSTVACTQVAMIEKLLCLALDSDEDDGATAAVVDTLWSTHTHDHVAGLDTAEDELTREQSGLVLCLERMIAVGVYVDSMLAIRIQCAIVSLVTSLLQRAHKKPALLQSLVGCGLLRSVCRFYQSLFASFAEISRLNLSHQFAKEHDYIQSTLRRSWQAVLLCVRRMGTAKDVWDSGMLRALVYEWIPCSKQIKMQGSSAGGRSGDGLSSNSNVSPYVIRSEAIAMLVCLIDYSRHRVGVVEGTTATSQNDAEAHEQAIEFLLSECALALLSSDRISKEIALLRNLTQQQSTKQSTVKKGPTSPELRRTAATLLVALASLNHEDLINRLRGDGVPSMLLSLAAVSVSVQSQHTYELFALAVRDVWLKWSTGKYDASRARVGGAASPDRDLEAYTEDGRLDDEAALDISDEEVSSPGPRTGKDMLHDQRNRAVDDTIEGTAMLLYFY